MGWMKLGETSILSQVTRSPGGRSELLQQSVRSTRPPDLTQGQLSRLQVVDTVRFVLKLILAMAFQILLKSRLFIFSF